ncbi:MAG TPA: hypothetical protein VMT73_14250 [Anaerolineales bacterium]|nr:hypothetical protein [Anaerolineales bacterium]
MTIPALILGFLISSLYGALYHLLRGGNFWRMVMDLALAWAGFAAGHYLGLWRGWILFPLGPLNLGVATIGSLLFLGLGDWLSHIEVKQKTKV